MAYVRSKQVPSGGKVYTYYQLVEGYRDKDTGKVRQRVLKHLGKFDSIEDARAAARGVVTNSPPPAPDRG